MPEFLSEFVRFLFAAGLVLGGGLWLFSGWQRYVQPQQWIQLLHHAPSGMLLVGAKAFRPSALACAGQFDPNSRDLSFALTSLAEEIMASECDWF